MSGLYSSLLFSFAGLVIGFIGGQLIVWRRHGSLIVPTIHVREVRSNSDLLIGVLVVILAIGTLTQGVISQQRQTECNNEFRRVLSSCADSRLCCCVRSERSVTRLAATTWRTWTPSTQRGRRTRTRTPAADSGIVTPLAFTLTHRSAPSRTTDKETRRWQVGR